MGLPRNFAQRYSVSKLGSHTQECVALLNGMEMAVCLPPKEVGTGLVQYLYGVLRIRSMKYEDDADWSRHIS